MTKTALIVGGTSDIGMATARLYAARDWTIILAARDREAAERNAADLRARGQGGAHVAALDILETEGFQGFLESLPALPDTVVSLVGDLGDQRKSQADPAFAARVLRANFEGPALFLEAVAERFARRGSGVIVGVSSVAGDRGRASNYTYGSAKAGFTAFLSGLRNRLAGSGVRVVTVKPGFVRTRMTSGMDLPGALTAEPDQVARAIWRAAEEGRGEIVYVLWMWRFVMLAIRSIPETIFKRLKL